MTDLSKDPSGTPEPTPVAADQDSDSVTTQKDSVQYETYRKVLSEKKRQAELNTQLQAKLSELENAEKERQETQLKEQNQWQELAKLKEQEAEQARQEAMALRSQQQDARKLDAVLNALPGQVPRDYWGLIDLEKVIVNPDTGDIEATSVKSLADEFIQRHKRVIDFPGSGARIDPQAPQPNGAGSVSINDFAKMSADEKAANLGKIDGMPDWLKSSQGRRQQ